MFRRRGGGWPDELAGQNANFLLSFGAIGKGAGADDPKSLHESEAFAAFANAAACAVGKRIEEGGLAEDVL